MAVTKLVRKGRRNVAVAKARVNKMKRLNAQPVIKNVDVEEIKASFESKPAKKAEKKEAKAKVEEVVTETTAKAEAPVEEVVAATEEATEVKVEETETKEEEKKD